MHFFLGALRVKGRKITQHAKRTGYFIFDQDTRRKEMCSSFSAGSTSVRDVQFCPPQLSYFAFASADDGGNVHVSTGFAQA